MIASPIVQEAYLGVRGEPMSDAAAPTGRRCTPTSAPTTSCTGWTWRCRAGELTVLLGRNGAGKTTTLRTIMGLWRASPGSVRFDGEDIAGSATPEIARRGIAYVPENMGIFARPHGVREHGAGGQ